MRKSILLSLFVGLGACGGDSSFRSSLPPEEPLETLEDEQLQTLCEEGLAFFDLDALFVRLECFFVGFGAATDGGQIFNAAACDAEFRACLSDPPPPEQRVFDVSDLDCSMVQAGATANCTATVQEWEACLTGLRTLLQNVSNELTCDLGQLLELAETIQSLNALPAECQAIADECPDFFDGAFPGGNLTP